MKTVGERIKTLRKKHKMTLEQLGDKVGVGKSTVRKWENGVISNMRQDKIAKLAEALDTTPAELMGWEKDSPPISQNDIMIGKRIKDLRESRDMSLMEMAKEFGITVDELERYEKGSERVPFELVKKMSDFFNIDTLHNLGLNYQLHDGETKFNASMRILEVTDRWNKEVGETRFSDKEMSELISFANYLIGKRKK